MIFNLTSPAFGGATVTSSTLSGSLGAHATAALQTIGCASVDSDISMAGMLGNERRFELPSDVEARNLLTRKDAMCGSKTKNMRDVRKEIRLLNILGSEMPLHSVLFSVIGRVFKSAIALHGKISASMHLVFSVRSYRISVTETFRRQKITE